MQKADRRLEWKQNTKAIFPQIVKELETAGSLFDLHQAVAPAPILRALGFSALYPLPQPSLWPCSCNHGGHCGPVRAALAVTEALQPCLRGSELRSERGALLWLLSKGLGLPQSEWRGV